MKQDRSRTGRPRSRKKHRGVEVSREARLLVHTLREQSLFTPEQLAEKAEISARTVSEFENPDSKRRRFDRPTIERIARALALDTDRLLPSTSKAPELPVVADFETLNNQLDSIDASMLDIVRQLGSAKPQLLDETYQAMLEYYLAKHGFSRQTLLQSLQAPWFRAQLAASLPNASLNIHVDERLHDIAYRFDHEELLLNYPLLLWDCSCYPRTEANRSPDCRIHAIKELGNEIETRFYGRSVELHYRDLRFRWRDSRALWPPSIDSFRMLLDIESEGVFRERFRRVLDLGSGTGFLGITVAAQNPHVQQLDLVDWLLTPFLYGNVNLELNRKRLEHIRIRSRLSLVRHDVIINDEYDLVLCNPPFLPLLDGFKDVGVTSTVVGTDVFVSLIRGGRKLGQRIYVRLSQLSWKEAEEAARQSGAVLRPIGKPQCIPLRIQFLWKHSKYLEALHSRGLVTKDGERYRYWHNVQTYLVEYTNA